MGYTGDLSHLQSSQGPRGALLSTQCFGTTKAEPDPLAAGSFLSPSPSHPGDVKPLKAGLLPLPLPSLAAPEPSSGPGLELIPRGALLSCLPLTSQAWEQDGFGTQQNGSACRAASEPQAPGVADA